MPLVGYWETNEDCCGVAGGVSTRRSVFGGKEAEGGIGLVGVVMLHKSGPQCSGSSLWLRLANSTTHGIITRVTRAARGQHHPQLNALKEILIHIF